MPNRAGEKSVDKREKLMYNNSEEPAEIIAVLKGLTK